MAKAVGGEAVKGRRHRYIRYTRHIRGEAGATSARLSMPSHDWIASGGPARHASPSEKSSTRLLSMCSSRDFESSACNGRNGWNG